MPSGRRIRDRGYTYVVVLIWVALAGIGLALTGELWRTTAQREREDELLFIGEQFRRAITSYYESSPGVQRFPTSLSALIHDERFPGVRRHVRKIYADPMTGKAEWGLVKQPEGGIVGVYSLSTARPLRTANFAGPHESFKGKVKYSEWVFRSDVAAAGTTGTQTAPAITGNSTPAPVPAAATSGAPAAVAIPSGAQPSTAARPPAVSAK